MTYYFHIENDKIVGKGQAKLLNAENIVVTKEVYDESEKYIYQDGGIILNPNYEEEQALKEKERIQELFMTRSDFFDGTIDAWGVGEDELLFLVQRMLTGLPLENNQKLKAINNFNNALNFYRKHDLFKMLIGMPIQLTETTQVIITEESLDKYFDEVTKGNKNTAWQYLPQPIAIPIESNVTERPVEESSYDDI